MMGGSVVTMKFNLIQSIKPIQPIDPVNLIQPIDPTIDPMQPAALSNWLALLQGNGTTQGVREIFHHFFEEDMQGNNHFFGAIIWN